MVQGTFWMHIQEHCGNCKRERDLIWDYSSSSGMANSVTKGKSEIPFEENFRNDFDLPARQISVTCLTHFHSYFL